MIICIYMFIMQMMISTSNCLPGAFIKPHVHALNTICCVLVSNKVKSTLNCKLLIYCTNYIYTSFCHYFVSETQIDVVFKDKNIGIY